MSVLVGAWYCTVSCVVTQFKQIKMMMMTTSTIKMQAYGITGDLMDKLLPL